MLDRLNSAGRLAWLHRCMQLASLIGIAGLVVYEPRFAWGFPLGFLAGYTVAELIGDARRHCC